MALAQTHAIERTSPVGQAFVGTCRLCGTPNLTSADALKPCPNNRLLTEDEALIEAITGEPAGDDAADIVFTDRYASLGMQRPDPGTMCTGQCEGIGYVPIEEGDEDEVLARLWAEAEAKEPTDDGWHFVRCPDCGGTGKRPVVLEILP